MRDNWQYNTHLDRRIFLEKKMVAFNSTVTAPFDLGPFSDPGFILVVAEPQKAQSFRPTSEGVSNPSAQVCPNGVALYLIVKFFRICELHLHKHDFYYAGYWFHVGRTYRLKFDRHSTRPTRSALLGLGYPYDRRQIVTCYSADNFGFSSSYPVKVFPRLRN